METSESYVASDYAGIKSENVSFYYGYEHAICQGCGKTVSDCCNECDDHDVDWCFVATVDGKETVIPSSDLGGEMFEVTEGLLNGIAKFMIGKKIVQVS